MLDSDLEPDADDTMFDDLYAEAYGDWDDTEWYLGLLEDDINHEGRL